MEKMGIDPFTSKEYDSFERKTYTPQEVTKKNTAAAVNYYEESSTNPEYIATPVKVVPNIYDGSNSKLEEANVSSEQEVKKDCKKVDSKVSFSNNNKITQLRILKQLNKAR